MTCKKLLSLLTEDYVSVTLKCGEGGIRIEPNIWLKFSEDGGKEETGVGGFEISVDGEIKAVKTPDGLLSMLEQAGAVKDGEVFPVKIDDSFSSLEEYEKEQAFRQIDMAGLLKIYLPLSDSFSLTCPYDDSYDNKHPFGIYNLPEELAQKALEDIGRVTYESAERLFNHIPEEVRAKLPPFGELYGQIKDEYESYYKKHLKKAEKCGGTVFFGDEFAKGKTKYCQPQELWHVYQEVDSLGACRYTLEQMQKNTLRRPIDCELDDKKYSALKDSLLKTEVTFSWHCTTSGMLSKVFYFELNDKTVKWLSGLKNDYDLDYLEDLAFYKDGEVLFSSCTHEGFHIGFKK